MCTRTLHLILAALFFLFLGAAPSQGQITDGDVAGLIAAINAANANPGTDIIELAPNGIYTLTAADNADNGLPVISSQIDINGNGATIERSSTAGTPNFRVFNIDISGDLTLLEVTVKGGHLIGQAGGGILNAGTVRIIDGVVTGNRADGGAGIWNVGGLVELDGSSINGNTDRFFGAGVWNSSAVLTLTNSSIDDNVGRLRGTGIYNLAGSVTLIKSTVSGNVNGTGIMNHLGSSRLTLINSTVSGNGGTGLNDFGGIVNAGGIVELVNSTVSDNIASAGNGGINNASGDISLKSTIVANNSPSDCFGTVTTLGHNLFENPGSCIIVGSGTGDIVGVDPILSPLADHGGLTETHKPLLGSPVIDAIPLADCTDLLGDAIEEDQRGFKPRPFGAGCDIGAYEVGAAEPVTNQPPVADAGGSYDGDEGAAISLSGATASDPDADPLTLSWSVDTSPTTATCTFSDDSVLNPDLTCDDYGTFTATLIADDGTAAPVSSDATVTVANVDPDVGVVTIPTDPIDINDQPVTGVSADFSDPGTNDTHICTVDYDDGTGPQVGTISGTTCEGPDQTYADPGVYEVTFEVTDDDSGMGSATATTFIVIYDPADGFVTGGGWIDSPDGACPTFCDNATGTANFGFVSKYRRGASVPDGQTEFNFTAGDLNFHSTSYDWLVIAGAKAMYKGDGTVNGVAGFTFQINAIDGSLPGGGGVDKFRIKIKEPGGEVIYDNQMGAGDNDDPTTALGGGQIKIHSGGNGGGGNGNQNLVVDGGEEVPDAFALYGSYPNPFNPATTLRYDVPESAQVRLVVFDVLGRQISVLVDGMREAGTHEVVFEASDLPSGTYLYRLETPQGSFVRTMLLAK